MGMRGNRDIVSSSMRDVVVFSMAQERHIVPSVTYISDVVSAVTRTFGVVPSVTQTFDSKFDNVLNNANLYY